MIDISFKFTSDTPGFWEGFWERRDGLGLGGADPDSLSPTLQEYHRLLWSKELPNGQKMELKKGSASYYLTWGDYRFGSDTIITDFRYGRNMNILDQVRQRVPDFKAFIKSNTERAYTIGGTIVFPKHMNSLNQCRGTNRLISDRWDLTMECIRRHYEKQESPLSKVLDADSNFFNLFVDFKGYVDYFLLQDCVSEDYRSVIIWDGKGDFSEDGLPKTCNNYLSFVSKEYEFLEKRNKRIGEYAKMKGL